MRRFCRFHLFEFNQTTIHRPIPRLLITCALLLAAAPAFGDWNVATGGNAARSGYVGTVGTVQSTRVWEGTRFTRFVRPIAVSEGRILASWNQSGSAFNEVVAMDITDGTELWSVELPTAGADPTSERSRVSGARDGRVYATRATSRTNPLPMHALDANDGTILWTSVAGITESSSQSLTFAPDGDLICQGGPLGAEGLYRIDRDSGATVWFAPCIPHVDDSNGAVVHGTSVYAWNFIVGALRVSAFDLASGALKYSSDAIPSGGPATQQGLFVGLDGKIYAPRSGSPSVTNLLYALEDTGAALVTRWTFPCGFGVFSTHGVGPDGSIYTHDRDGHVVRLASADGSTIARSASPIPGAAATDFSPRMAVDSMGNVFLSNGSFSNGAIAAYDVNLDLLWSEEVGTQSITGPALSADGELVVQTRFQGMIVYKAESQGVGEGRELAAAQPSLLGPGAPNPFHLETRLDYSLPVTGRVRLTIHDASGRRVRTLVDRVHGAGSYAGVWRGRDDLGARLPSGVYFARMESAGKSQTQRIELVR